MKKFSFRPVPHSPFSLDLAPSDFCLFGTIKRRVRDRQFHAVGELMEAIGDVPGSIRPNELEAVFRNWKDQLAKRIELDREHVDSTDAKVMQSSFIHWMGISIQGVQ
jgi:hypothetical protein